MRLEHIGHLRWRGEADAGGLDRGGGRGGNAQVIIPGNLVLCGGSRPLRHGHALLVLLLQLVQPEHHPNMRPRHAEQMVKEVQAREREGAASAQQTLVEGLGCMQYSGRLRGGPRAGERTGRSSASRTPRTAR